MVQIFGALLLCKNCKKAIFSAFFSGSNCSLRLRRRRLQFWQRCRIFQASPSARPPGSQIAASKLSQFSIKKPQEKIRIQFVHEKSVVSFSVLNRNQTS